MTTLYGLTLLFGLALTLAYCEAKAWTWAAALGVAVTVLALTTDGSWLAGWLAVGLLVLAAIEPLRRTLVVSHVLRAFRRLLPPMSETERDALEAGTVWWDGELFSGRPAWNVLMDIPHARLTSRERNFIDGPTETLCRMLDDWQINFELRDLPSEVWLYLREQGFFGLIIPEEHGGKGFSHFAHSAVVEKIASRSIAAAVTVMVPNSLGPAELLMRYGTTAQRQYWLPRLAAGQEIPCFALTGPMAGSDAASIPDRGVVCYGEHEGQQVLGLRVTWEKRYITLAPVATVLGVAFKASDPNGLLGDAEDLGITLALIPATHRGVRIGRRHYPASQAFQNGPTSGDDVFIPIDWVIGERAGVGEGWRMLMNCLAAGRAISLPALSSAAAKTAARLTGAYARVRKQFKVPVGKFEGVEEALTRIATTAYSIDSARRVTCAALEQGHEPAVISAMLKYRATEGMRQVLNDAMDIHGGRGICAGPSNYLLNGYQGIPVGITVEGANILTRGLIVFGQGALRCHPWLIREMEAARLEDEDAAVRNFDEALTGHIRHLVGNVARALVLNVTAGGLAPSPRRGKNAKWYRQIGRTSASVAALADFMLLVLGAELKVREKISGRFADILSELYLMSCTLKRFDDEASPQEDQPIVNWIMLDGLYRIQQAMDSILENVPSRPVAWLLRIIVFPYGLTRRTPRDRLGHQVARLLLEPSATRDRLTTGVFVCDDPTDPMGRTEYALTMTLEAEPIEAKLAGELKTGRIPVDADPVETAVQNGVITGEEAKVLEQASRAVRGAIDVDDFDPAHLSPRAQVSRSDAASAA